jgi:hypothetical protein
VGLLRCNPLYVYKYNVLKSKMSGSQDAVAVWFQISVERAQLNSPVDAECRHIRPSSPSKWTGFALKVLNKPPAIRVGPLHFFFFAGAGGGVCWWWGGTRVWTLHLQSMCSTTQATPPIHFAMVSFLEMGVSWTICPGWARTTFLLISAFKKLGLQVWTTNTWWPSAFYFVLFFWVGSCYTA